MVFFVGDFEGDPLLLFFTDFLADCVFFTGDFDFLVGEDERKIFDLNTEAFLVDGFGGDADFLDLGDSLPGLCCFLDGLPDGLFDLLTDLFGDDLLDFLGVTRCSSTCMSTSSSSVP